MIIFNENGLIIKLENKLIIKVNENIINLDINKARVIRDLLIEGLKKIDNELLNKEYIEPEKKEDFKLFKDEKEEEKPEFYY